MSAEVEKGEWSNMETIRSGAAVQIDGNKRTVVVLY